MKPPIINLAALVLSPQSNGARFAARTASIGAPLGARRLGGRLVVLDPGKRAWPLHAHLVNEEWFLILEGTGTLRFGTEEFPLKPMDVVVCPPGGTETAHQIVNTGPGELRYVALSSMLEPDVMEYPDSGKFGVLAGAAPGGPKKKRTFSFFGRAEDAKDYFDGEE